MTYAIRSHMAAEGVDADLPTLHRKHALARENGTLPEGLDVPEAGDGDE